MTESATIHEFIFNDSYITYQKFGNGPAMLLAFHGFGQSSQVFRPLEKSPGEQFTVFAIDLFFHGKSYYGANQLLTKTVWNQLIDQFLQAQCINRFSVAGFSLGGRFALATVEAFADRLDQLILIAPDGITRSVWYRLATNSRLGRRLFQNVLSQLPLLTMVGHALTRVGLLNRTAMRFAEISLGRPEQRDRVYQCWTQFRLIRPDLNAIARLLNYSPTQVGFFVGAFDRIVPGFYVIPLTKRLLHYKLTVLRTGHNHLIELVAEQLT